MQRRRLDAIVITALIALGVVLGRIQSTSRELGKVDPVTGFARAVLRPAAAGLSGIARSASDVGVALSQGRSLKAENERLRTRVAEYEMDRAETEDLRTEVDELRRLGGWAKRPGRAKVPADVISYSPLENRIQLSVGSAQGIERGMPVATSAGLVARIESVDRDSCQALLITSAEDGAMMTALVQRPTPNPLAAGIIRGNGSGMLLLELTDPTVPVDAGALVYTSGFSERIPRGISIGRVVSVSNDPAFGKRTATVVPTVAVGSVREVLVLK